MKIKTKRLNINELPELLTVREVADLFRVSTLTIKRWGKKGTFPAIRINSRGDRRYKKDIILKLLGGNTQGSTNTFFYTGTTVPTQTISYKVIGGSMQSNKSYP